jgi:transposase
MITQGHQTLSVRSQILERRRLRAWELYNRGWKAVDIASALDVSSAAVSQWLSRARTEGSESLRSRPKPGAPRALTERHLLMLRVLLKSSPRDLRIESDIWTRPLVAEYIERLFGRRFSVQHVGRLMRRSELDSKPIPKVVRLELEDLLQGVDVSRIRTRISRRHGKY